MRANLEQRLFHRVLSRHDYKRQGRTATGGVACPSYHLVGMDLTATRNLEHVGLPTACAIVYAAVTGAPPDPRRPEDMQAVLNEVARAMAYVVRIYAADSVHGVPRAIGGFDALRGQFIRGAHGFQRPDGERLERLTVQRRDMLRAMEVLRSAGVKFRVAVAG
jgi:hypothetical protein